MLIAERLKKLPSEIWGMPADQALRLLHYFAFLTEYEEESAVLAAAKNP